MHASHNTIAVLGAGSWGTALAMVLARNGHQVRLWGRDPDQVALMNKLQCNPRYLPGVTFPERLTVSASLQHVLHAVRDVLVVTPSDVFRTILENCKPYLQTNSRVIWASKGLDPRSGQLLHTVAQEILGEKIPLAVLSGPSFAREVAAGFPTAITLAATDPQFAKELLGYFHSDTFRVYLSQDLIGVEIGGAVKNVLAVAAGIADGLGFGANTRAALITRGLVEMMRLGLALGGKQETFIGLAGLGDLVLTCTDNQSRNRRFGLSLGTGHSSVQAQEAIGQVIEARSNTAEIYELARKLLVEVPIIEQVYRVLCDKVTPKEAVRALMSREPKSEG